MKTKLEIQEFVFNVYNHWSSLEIALCGVLNDLNGDFDEDIFIIPSNPAPDIHTFNISTFLYDPEFEIKSEVSITLSISFDNMYKNDINESVDRIQDVVDQCKKDRFRWQHMKL